jgi:Uma2 family endonuclease
MAAETTPVTATDELITGAELYEMGNIGRCELVEGRVIRMSPVKPGHGRFEFRLAKRISDYVEANDLGEVMVGEVGIYVRREPDTVRGADILYISHEKLAKATPESFLDVAPELIVEIMSPSDRWVDVKRKLREYLSAGVNVVWVVEPDAGVISVYRSPTDVQEFSDRDVLVAEDILPGFSLPLADLF